MYLDTMQCDPGLGHINWMTWVVYVVNKIRKSVRVESTNPELNAKCVRSMQSEKNPKYT